MMSDAEILKWIYENTNGVHIYPINIDLYDAQSPFLDDHDDQIKLKIDMKNGKHYAYLIPIDSLAIKNSMPEYFSYLIKAIEEGRI